MDNLQRVQKMIADDSYAMSFQSMRQYRSALLENIDIFNKEDKSFLNNSPTLLSWLEDFCNQLDCPPPSDTEETLFDIENQAQWETQMFILKKLRYAINAEKERVSAGQNRSTNETDRINSEKIVMIKK